METQARFKHLVGKQVTFIDDTSKKRVGKLVFAGINDLLHNQFQVTIGNCPVWPVDPNTLKSHISNVRIFKK